MGRLGKTRGEIMKDKTKDELLNIFYHSRDSGQRRKARLYLWKTMDSLSNDELAKCAETGTEIEKEIAQWYLWRRHLDTSMSSLLCIIHEDRDADHVHEAAILIGEKKYVEALDDLIELLCQSKDAYIKEGAAHGLRELGDPRAFPYIVQQLRDNPDFAEGFVYALELFDCRGILEMLIDLFVAQPKAALLRANVRGCIRNQDLDNTPESVLDNCLLKLDLAMQRAMDPDDVEELEALYKILKRIE